MIVVYDHRTTTFVRKLIKPFSKEFVHCYPVIFQGPGRYLYYDFDANEFQSIYRSGLPDNLAIRNFDVNDTIAQDWLDSRIGKDYDNKAIIKKHLLGIGEGDPEKDTCVEIVLGCLKHCGIYNGNITLTPTEAFYI